MPLTWLPRQYRSTPPPATARIDPMHPQARGLIGYWPFLEGRGTRLHDYSNRRDHGTFSGSNFVWNRQLNGYAVDFNNGSGNFVNIPFADYFNNTSALSISIWFRPETGVGVLENLINKSSGTAAAQNDFRVTRNTDDTITYAIGNRSQKSVGVTPDTEWHHFIGAWDGTNITLFLDGAQLQTIELAVTLNNTTADIRLAAKPFSATADQWPGSLSDARIYNRGLNIDDAIELFTNPWSIFDHDDAVTRSAAAPPTARRFLPLLGAGR